MTERGPRPALRRHPPARRAPAPTGDGEVVVVVGESLEQRRRALEGLHTLLAIGGPLALLVASLAGYAVAAAALRPVERMRRRAAELTGEAEGRLPVPPSRDEIARLGDTLNAMLGRLAGGARARALVRLRRQPRAAHAAGDPAHRARAGAARAQHARRARGRRALGGRGDRPPQPARRRPARDRALGPGPAAGAPGRDRRARAAEGGGPPLRRAGALGGAARCAPSRRTA